MEIQEFIELVDKNTVEDSPVVIEVCNKIKRGAHGHVAFSNTSTAQTNLSLKVKSKVRQILMDKYNLTIAQANTKYKKLLENAQSVGAIKFREAR
jgi:hypothetical protein